MPASPEALFADLTRPAGGPPYLWAHQADLLRAYHDHHLDSGDVAIELPTGAGKTLVGQLVGDWRRRARSERVAYLCPTKQLAAQTTRQAYLSGIPVVSLVGDHREWDQDSVQRFFAGEAMAVTTYSHMFNSAPKLGSVQVAIFDDAHAGESYVADAWTISIPRQSPDQLFPSENPLYHALLDLFAPRLDTVFLKMVRDAAPDAGWYHLVEQVPPEHLHAIAPQLFVALREQDGPHRFPLTRVGGHSGACLALVSWPEIGIRPLIPPTSSLDIFSRLTQRIYMSATLGESGELERAFGRPTIARLPVPKGWESHGSGRRFFMFADRVQGATGAEAAAAIVQNVRKGLVLSPDERSLTKAKAALAGELTVFDKSDVEQSMAKFAAEPEALLMLTNRYDGIDLPGSDCRLVVLDQLPSGVHLLERFVVKTVGASRVLQERVRTRIVQGAGRCTRSPSDFAIVLVEGTDITNFCGQAEVQKAMHPELQAELAFGWDNSRVPLIDAVANAQSFLDQDAVWIDEVDPRLNEHRTKARKQLPRSTAKFGSAAPFEVRAVSAAWDGHWSEAVELARAAADELDNDVDCREYRALLLYLASQWAGIAAEDEHRPELRDVAARALKDASRSATKSGWMNRPAGGIDGPADPLSEALVQIVAADFAAIATEKPVQFERICTALEGRLSGTDPTEYGLGLLELGRLLGFHSARHTEDAAPDVEWAPENGPWITVEAKSDESPQGEIGARTIRQANSHPRWMAQRRATTVPPGTISVIATPRKEITQVNADLADEYVRLADLEDVRDLARDAVDAWREIRGGAAGLTGDALRVMIRDRFRRNGVLGVDVFRRLGRRHPSDLVPGPEAGDSPSTNPESAGYPSNGLKENES